MLTIALPKGRLLEETVRFLRAGGIEISRRALRGRKLLIADKQRRYKFILVKPSDVPIYVEYGVADAGICGQDVLLEVGADLHQPLDLKFGACRIVLAGRGGSRPKRGGHGNASASRVATKYPRIAELFLRSRGLLAEVVVLSGSVELAPALGLAERVVDLVQTGRTLRENGLEVIEVIAESTARLVINRASYQLKQREIAELMGRCEQALRSRDAK